MQLRQARHLGVSMTVRRKPVKAKNDAHRMVKQALGNQHACYILITCESPSDSGEMNVQMSYEGDEDLAGFLLQGAQSHFDSQILDGAEDSHLQLVD